MANPKLTISLVGNLSVKSFLETYTWSPQAQIEQTVVIQDSDGDVSLSYDIDDIEFIIFQSDSAFTIKITSSGVTEIKEVNNIYLFNPTSAYMSTVSAISVSTSSTTEQLIEYKVYGA
jgi:hypothetical protein